MPLNCVQPWVLSISGNTLLVHFALLCHSEYGSSDKSGLNHLIQGDSVERVTFGQSSQMGAGHRWLLAS